MPQFAEGLGAALERAAMLYGDREAVVDGERRWDYRELRSRVAGFDAALDELGLVAGDVAGVLAANSADHLVCWLAIPRSGRVLNDLNTRLAPAELEFILGDSGARLLIVDDTFLALGRELVARCDSVEHLVHTGPGETPQDCLSFEALCATAGGRAPAPVDAEAVAGIFYTGGTTGLPKGAMLSHRNLVANAKHTLIAIGYDETDSYLHAAPMFHLADGASTYALTWVGGKHVILPAFDPASWLTLVAAEQVTRALLVPTMINMVITHPEAATADVSSLRSMLYGASPMPDAVLGKAMSVLPCGWLQAYGMTEAAPIVTCLTVADHARGATGEEPHVGRLRSAGRPVVGVEVEVRREDGVTPCDVDEPGEVFVRGPNVMQGYWNRPEETAQALVDGGWYRSGDAARVDAAGYVHIVDRVKDMIISGGENVYSTEVENAIHRHDAVLECAVFGIPHEKWGEQVHAAVVVREGASVDEAQVIEHCRPLIAGYKIPRSVEFLDALPKSGAGKILKKDLREPHWAGRERQVS
jgi:long-chain acyl-CoA synthetase